MPGELLHEQHTLGGYIEVIDTVTDEVKALKLLLTCEKDCLLCGEPFMEGEEIEVTFPADGDLIPGQTAKGPWQPGGYRSRWIRDNALEIVEKSRDRVIYAKIGFNR